MIKTGKTITLMAVVVALATTIALPSSATAQSRDELEGWIQSLVKIRKNECKDEDKRKVLKKIDYAATLLAHQEVEEAESVLAKAKSNAASAACQTALEKNGTFANTL